MSEIAYTPKRFSAWGRDIISDANDICREWTSQGYDLTLRQLYYRFIALDLFPENRWFWWDSSKWVRDPEHLNSASTKNANPNYKWLGKIISDARLAGHLDWDYIVDRTREIEEPQSWESPASIVDAAAQGYYIDRWEGQPFHPEVWVEKDALVGIIEQASDHHRVPYFSCRGYTSQSGLWTAAQRLSRYITQGQVPVILHLGDHDPSGIDMTRDIRERVNLFMLQDWVNDQIPGEGVSEDGMYDGDIQIHMAGFIDHLRDDGVGADHRVDAAMMPVVIKRIALNMDQIEDLDPPPSPAKVTDSRSKSYIERYGNDSWELDALTPVQLTALIKDEISELIDQPLWEETLTRETNERRRLFGVAQAFREGEEE